MSKQDLISDIESSFINMSFCKSDIGEPSKNSYTPVRNSSGGYDLEIAVDATGDVVGYVDDDVCVHAAKVRYIIALKNCTYSNEKGFTWNPEIGSCQLIHNRYIPSIITFSDATGSMNNGDFSGYRHTGGLTRDEDAELGQFLAERMFYNTRQAVRNEFISNYVASIKIDTCFAERFRKNPNTAYQSR